MQEPIDETALPTPENPYGASKLMSETILRDTAKAHDLSYVVLRYFNVAGADPAGRSGQLSKPATHLIKVASELACGKRDAMQIFGTDYDTPDGTCIRDYIHISDLIGAHMVALDHLMDNGAPVIANCGYGTGNSVRDVLASVARVSGSNMNVTEAPRRAGDAIYLVADSGLLKRKLGWVPQHDDLDALVKSALDWEGKFPD
jgi:UDP-glucose 4-epimerase